MEGYTTTAHGKSTKFAPTNVMIILNKVTNTRKLHAMNKVIGQIREMTILSVQVSQFIGLDKETFFEHKIVNIYIMISTHQEQSADDL